MAIRHRVQAGLLFLAPTLGFITLRLLRQVPEPAVVLRERQYQIVSTDQDATPSVFNVAVYQRNQDVHDLAVTAQQVVVQTIQQRRKSKRPMPPFMQIFFNCHTPNPGEGTNGEHRFTWSQWSGVQLKY